MGKLAERYMDHTRSGVYRVTSVEIPLAAALEANARVVEIGAEDVEALSERLRVLIAKEDRGPHVVLVRAGVPLAKLHDLAHHCRKNALPFFALLVDPSGLTDLPPLYKERG